MRNWGNMDVQIAAVIMWQSGDGEIRHPGEQIKPITIDQPMIGGKSAPGRFRGSLRRWLISGGI